ncbi:MAG: hypothetical protein A2Y98_00595 [Candidatus Portnoybacteria bacterium RBG_19FT_COMBO_36_7]|uniref:Uncharacterized protein n=1 Tax=Candidatus Portnoybacteria bacterium RBG_19FT_COMBO_36_7 TaxID=1801992 RepID=A0A1G2F7C3_9BACT|nr:MAG: hypothetical protein A2Y98_00595 [Candidatus Portnoybacteria bacterium RBG_19FT_COMBO_36_7]
MKKKILRYLLIISVITILMLPVIASAQGNEPPQIDLTADRLVELFDQIKTWFAQIIFILGIACILYAAFLYMTSGGDDSRIEKAKKTFIYGIVGIIVAMLAYGIWDAVESLLT